MKYFIDDRFISTCGPGWVCGSVLFRCDRVDLCSGVSAYVRMSVRGGLIVAALRDGLVTCCVLLLSAEAFYRY
jgi:hypothetical protein